MRLPGELRNHIFRLALVEKHTIRAAVKLAMPELLRSCRQFRHEGLPLYLLENAFYLTIYNCEIGNPLWLLRHLNCRHEVSMVVVQVMSWRKLKVWVKLYHACGSMPMPRYGYGTCCIWASAAACLTW